MLLCFQGVEKQDTVFLTLRNTTTLDTAGVMSYYPEMLENAIKRLTAAVKAKPEQEPDGWIGEENPKIPNSAYLEVGGVSGIVTGAEQPRCQDRKSTRLNCSHVAVLYAVVCWGTMRTM